eukprot:3534724-Amphidinium_carterae.1
MVAMPIHDTHSIATTVLTNKGREEAMSLMAVAQLQHRVIGITFQWYRGGGGRTDWYREDNTAYQYRSGHNKIGSPELSAIAFKRLQVFADYGTLEQRG